MSCNNIFSSFLRKILILIVSMAVFFTIGSYLWANSIQTEDKHLEYQKRLELHLKAWKKIITSKNLTDQLGVYASRSLAVKHPHLYLQADLEFISEVEKIKGIDKAYESDIRADLRIYLSLPHEEGNGFSFNLVNFDKLRVCKYEEILEKITGVKKENMALLPYFDVRVLPVKSTLKLYGMDDPTFNHVKPITSLELNFIRYIKMRLKSGYRADELYILYLENEDSFIYDAKRHILIDHYGKEVKLKKIKISPVIIINENESYYPLMGTPIDMLSQKMKKIAKRFACVEPALTFYEKELLPFLRKGLDLDTNDGYGDFIYDLAVIAAAHHSVGRRVRHSTYNDRWMRIFKKYFPEAQPIWRLATCMVVEILKSANLLSPLVSYLSTVDQKFRRQEKVNLEGEQNLFKISREWLNMTSTIDPIRRRRSTWGQLWFSNLTEYSIDETLRTRAGNCVSQSTNLYSILEFRHLFLDKEKPLQFQLVFEIKRGFRKFVSSHHLVMAMNEKSPFNSIVFDDGVACHLYGLFLPKKIQRRPGFIRPECLMVSFLASPEGWSFFRFYEEARGGFKNYSTLTPELADQYINTFFNFESLLNDIKDGSLKIDKELYDTSLLKENFPDGIFAVKFVPGKLRRFPLALPVERKKLSDALLSGEKILLDINRLQTN